MSLLISCWFALLAADRIDLLGGTGPIVLTPFLLLTPLVVAGALWQRLRYGTVFRIPPSAGVFALLLLALVTLVLISVFVSNDVTRSATRVSQLIIISFGALAVWLSIRDRHDAQAVVVRGARAGVLLFAAFNIAQLAALAALLPGHWPSSQLSLVSLVPDVYAGLIPRLSGPVVDSNRGGLVLVLYGMLLATGLRVNRWPWLAGTAVLLLLTLSRSSLLAGATGLLVLLFRHVRQRGGLIQIPPALLVAVATSVIVTTGALLVSPAVRAVGARAVQPLGQRFAVTEGSSRDHLRLLQRGLSTATRSVPATLHGIGYGSSHLVLQDFFPGDRYGNFHSVYVGLFAESGIFALLALLLLMALPVVRDAPLAPLVCAVAVFGVFYGALAEPTFWTALVAGWIPLDETSSRPNITNSPTAAPRIAPSSN